MILDWKSGDASDAELQIPRYALDCRAVLGLPFHEGRVVRTGDQPPVDPRTSRHRWLQPLLDRRVPMHCVTGDHAPSPSIQYEAPAAFGCRGFSARHGRRE